MSADNTWKDGAVFFSVVPDAECTHYGDEYEAAFEALNGADGTVTVFAWSRLSPTPPALAAAVMVEALFDWWNDEAYRGDPDDESGFGWPDRERMMEAVTLAIAPILPTEEFHCDISGHKVFSQGDLVLNDVAIELSVDGQRTRMRPVHTATAIARSGDDG